MGRAGFAWHGHRSRPFLPLEGATGRAFGVRPQNGSDLATVFLIRGRHANVVTLTGDRSFGSIRPGQR